MVWFWRISTRTAAFPVSGSHRFWRNWEETYGDALKVVKVNINFDLPLAEKCEVTAAPTLIFFKNGAEQDRRRGLVKKAELTEIVENLK